MTKILWQKLKMNYRRSWTLYKEANEKLSKSNKDKNKEGVSITQALYESGQRRIQDTDYRLQKDLNKEEEINTKNRRKTRKIMDKYSQRTQKELK